MDNISATNFDGIPGWCEGIEILSQIRPYVRHCGDEERAAWKIETRHLLDYLLVYIDSGCGRFEIAGESYDAIAGDLFWIPPDTPHRMEGYPPSMVCPYVHFDLQYRPESHWGFSIPEGMCDLAELRPLLHPPMPSSPFDDLRGRIRSHTNRRVGQLIREICNEVLRAQPWGFLMASGLLTSAIAEILRGQAGLDERHQSHVAALEAGADFLRRHCGENITVEAAAEVAGLSESYFRGLFTRHFGCSPRRYLRRSRIGQAKRLMTAGRDSLGRIARQTGFATVHSLSRAFRAEEGLSPSQYRQCGQASTPPQ